MHSFWLALMMVAALCLVELGDASADGKDKKEPDKTEKKTAKQANLRILSPTGEEADLADWHFTQGARRFSLAKDAKPKSGPEYLEFREEKSTTYQNGILTLVPLSAIRKIDYDKEKKTVAVVVLTEGDKDETLHGTTRFIGINKITIEGDLVLKEGLATHKVLGGVDKGGAKRITFPSPKALGEVKGKYAAVIAADKEKSKHEVHDLQPLYLVDGSYRLLPYLMFKKTVKFDMDRIATLRAVPSENKKVISYDFEVTLKDGAQHTLSLLTKIDVENAKSATFEGLIGRVAAGYKLFPPHTIQQAQFGEPKEKFDAE
jgi:hypothetical protein